MPSVPAPRAARTRSNLIGIGLLALASSCIVSAPCSAETGDDPDERATLGIILSLPTRLDPAIIQEMQVETGRILRPLGLRLEWRLGYNAAHGESFNHLVSAKIGASCSPIFRHAPAVKLGFTHITDGDVLPYCEVDCAAISYMIQPAIRREGLKRATILLGRSLARVLAHEIYHVLARTRDHGRRGVAKPSLAADDLIRDHLYFDIPQIEAMRAHVFRPVLGRPGPPPYPDLRASGTSGSR